MLDHACNLPSGAWIRSRPLRELHHDGGTGTEAHVPHFRLAPHFSVLGGCPRLGSRSAGPSTTVESGLLINRADRKSQFRQCLGFCTADFMSLLAYESAKQKPQLETSYQLC